MKTTADKWEEFGPANLKSDFNEQFLKKLWEGGSHTNFTTVKTGEKPKTQWMESGSIEWPKAQQDLNTYFGIHPQKAIPEGNRLFVRLGQESSTRKRLIACLATSQIPVKPLCRLSLILSKFPHYFAIRIMNRRHESLV